MNIQVHVYAVRGGGGDLSTTTANHEREQLSLVVELHSGMLALYDGPGCRLQQWCNNRGLDYCHQLLNIPLELEF